MALPQILALLASLGSTVLGGIEESKRSNAISKSKADIERAQAERDKMDRQEARRNAIARALDLDQPLVSKERPPIPQPYQGEGLAGYRIGRGLLDVAGRAATTLDTDSFERPIRNRYNRFPGGGVDILETDNAPIYG